MKFAVKALAALFCVSLVFSSGLFAQDSGSLNRTKMTKSQVLRLFPDDQSDTVTTLKAGQSVLVLQNANGWSLVSLNDGARSLKGWVPTAYLSAAAAPIERAPASESDLNYLRTSDPTQNLLFPTALSLPRGTKTVRGVYFLGWELNYSLTDSTTLGARGLLPLGLLGGGIRLRQTLSLGEYIHIGATGEVGGIASLVEKRNTRAGMYFAAGPALTFGTEKAAVSMGTYILGGRVTNNYGHILMLESNAHYRINQMFKVMLEGFMPIRTHKKGMFGNWGVLAYGLRIGGSNVSGDVGFAIPIFKKTGKFLKYVPLGIPFITLNFAW